MRILILEDNAERILEFYYMFNEHSLVVVNMADEAIRALELKFDIIFLDHDLDGRTFVDSNEKNTGYQVAKVIPNTINNTTPIVVHSWNGEGALNMKSALKNQKATVVHEFFSTFDRSIIKSLIKERE